MQRVELARHFEFFGLCKHAVDALLGLPMIFAQNYTSEVFAETRHLDFEVSEIGARSLLLLVQHGADLEYFVA